MRQRMFWFAVVCAAAASGLSVRAVLDGSAGPGVFDSGNRPVVAQQAPVTAPGGAPTGDVAGQYKAVLDRYCITCHNDRLKTGGLTLQNSDLTSVVAHAEQWEKVVRKLRIGMMPPAGSPRPDQQTYDSMTGWLQTALDRVQPNPGRPRGMHRLNRAEYANAVRDVLGLEIDVETLLPPDDSSFGFDNVADVLGVSPALQERYLDAATKVSALAVGDVAQFATPEDEVLVVRPDVTQTGHIEGLPFGTRGGGVFFKHFPVDGDYQFKGKLFRTNLGNMRGLDAQHKLIVLIDGEQVFETMVGGPEDTAAIRRNATAGADAVDARISFRVPVKAGRHAVGITFVQKSHAETPTTLQPFEATLDHIDPTGISKIDQLKITGPFNPTGPGDTPSRRRIFTCNPASPADETRCARMTLGTIARRAFRRPIGESDMKVLMQFFAEGRSDRDFDAGIGLALRYILASPEFAFRVEADPANVAPGAAYRLSDVELASRLSFFLWSTVPDDGLLNAAAQGTLKNSATLARQVRRMLDDPKAAALTQNFAGQWLYLRNLKNVTPNYNDFPEFDSNLRNSMRIETEMFFDSIVREDRSILDLLTADYTFLNERLAKHYDVKGVYGSQFRRVHVTEEARRGLLGQGSILTVTSVADRTSPVRRGKWVLENILGTPPPPPPPNVPVLMTAAASGAKPKTMREEMEAHRANPTCAACHRLMDPIGFAMENFDGIGAWRTLYPGTASSSGTPIDVTGQLADGSRIEGPASLRQALLRRPDIFVQTVTEKLMVYALGRGLDSYDMPTVRKIVRDAAATNYKFSSLVMGVVTSAPFQMRVKTPQESETTTAAR